MSTADYFLQVKTKSPEAVLEWILAVQHDVIYSKLGILSRKAHELRLITLNAGCFSDCLVALLTTESLNDHPVYQALSYTWGSGPSHLLIELNGQPFPIKTELWLAL